MLSAFLGSWLLFTLELIVARLLLPSFGGSAWVWTASLTFYQAVLFAAYLYTATPWARSRKIHLALLGLSVLFLPIRLRAAGGGLAELLLALLPTAPVFFVLGTTSPVMQSALESVRGRPVYQLYSWSNAGALLALISYPLLLEPRLPLAGQLRLWMGIYALYLIETARLARDTPMPPRGRPHLSWVLMAMGPSAALAAATNLLMLDFAAVPLVWIIPLALYLSTFIITFRDGEAPTLGPWALGLMLAWLVTAIFSPISKFLFINIALFLLCFVAHRALARRKPEGRAPEFYACLALGGWLGSALIGWIMPFASRNLALPELDWALAGVLTMSVLIWYAPDRPKFGTAKLAAVAVFLAAAGVFYVRNSPGFDALASRRNLYGFYRVTETHGRRYFFHGNTAHGMELAARPGEPMLYYHRRSPVAELMPLVPAGRVAALGLGVGLVASYGKKGQTIDFYEIDPDVVELARDNFSYLSRSSATIHYVTGDARVMLERSSQKYDAILVDVFSGGAIPVHLLTREAFELYGEHLAPDGLLILHVTNRFLELRPVVAAVPGWHGLSKTSERSKTRPDEEYATSWVALKREPFSLPGWEPLEKFAGKRPWTDEHAALWSALR